MRKQLMFSLGQFIVTLTLLNEPVQGFANVKLYIDDEKKLNELNQKLLEQIQQSGKLFLTHTKLDGKYTIRIVLGNTNLEKRHMDKAWKLIQEFAQNMVA